MRKWLVVGAVAAAAVALGAVALAQESRDVDVQFHSVALAGPGHAVIVLPPDYATSGKRYPVVYFLHGLPARRAPTGTSGGSRTRLRRRAATRSSSHRREHAPAIRIRST
ncbi:MAG TPA: hypothetical protein VGJ77_19160 [Gaiellaceae bacterium]